MFLSDIIPEKGDVSSIRRVIKMDMNKINILAECMDINPESIKPDMILKDFVEWDSIAAISFISAMDENYGKVVTGEDIKALVTVQDALDLMC